MNTDITDQVDMEDVPLCPLCGQPILFDAQLAVAYGMVCAIHAFCADED